MIPPFLIGAGLLGLIFLSGRRAQAAARLPDEPVPAEPPRRYGLDEPQISTPIPAGWRRMKSSEVTPELLGFAQSQVSTVAQKPYGTTIPHSDRVMALVEQHYHEPLGPVKPWGYHHGVTLITRT